jgi:hypothetical protein
MSGFSILENEYHERGAQFFGPPKYRIAVPGVEHDGRRNAIGMRTDDLRSSFGLCSQLTASTRNLELLRQCSDLSQI